MPIAPPKIALRIGSHSEKEYFEKLAVALDAMVFGGNLLEITPAATSSLLHLLKKKRGGKPIPYFLDPMTYCFGRYVDKNGQAKSDLAPLKSEQYVAGTKKKAMLVKSSYMSLAKSLGSKFEATVNDGDKTAAIKIDFSNEAVVDELCQGVADYQWNRVHDILATEVVLQGAASETRPAAIFAPYFFISEQWISEGIEQAALLARRAAALEERAPVHAVICGCIGLLTEDNIMTLVKLFSASGVAGVWLWLDGFDECTASSFQLSLLRKLVTGLSENLEVYNMHGGYYSLLLSHSGMTGISHGVGYGERKQVQQVQGAAAPLVRYYLPGLRRRVGIPELELALNSLKISTPEEYFEKICGCQICKGVIGNSTSNIASFQDEKPSKGPAGKLIQTPASAKMCRYHFLLNRLSEPKSIATLTPEQLAGYVVEGVALLEKAPSLKKEFLVQNGDGGFPYRWAAALV